MKTKPFYKLTRQELIRELSHRKHAQVTRFGPDGESGYWLCAPGTAQDYYDLGSTYTAGQIERGELRASLQWCRLSSRLDYETLQERLVTWEQDGA